MAATEAKSIRTPDETSTFDNGKLEVVTLSDVVFAKATFEPGWRWSQSLKPIQGTDSCQVHHHGYVVSGRLHITMEDGSEAEVGPGDVVTIPPGHDAWTVGDEPCVFLDFSTQVVQSATP
jgi:mannose-6-phosphate isomerase-like protein (cupin superfamily)